MGPPALRLEHVSLLAGADYPILTDVSLEVSSAETVALVGPSGSGKTTILNVIAGLLQPSSGAVWVLGTDMVNARECEKSRLRALGIGIVFQGFHLVGGASAMENVLLPAYFGERPASQSRARARELLRRVGLEEWVESPVADLSEGQRQRVAIARALLARPSLVLADEPTGNLDDLSADSILSLLVDIVRDGGATLVLATHDRRCLARVGRTLQVRKGTVALG